MGGRSYRDAFGLFPAWDPFNHEFPLRPDHFVTKKIIAAACRIKVGSHATQLGNLAIQRDWGWAPEYVEAMWRILQQPKADDFVIAPDPLIVLRILWRGVWRTES